MIVREYVLRNGLRLIGEIVTQPNVGGIKMKNPHQMTSHFDPCGGPDALWFPFFDFMPASKKKILIIQKEDILFGPIEVSQKWLDLFLEMTDPDKMTDRADQILTEKLSFSEA